MHLGEGAHSHTLLRSYALQYKHHCASGISTDPNTLTFNVGFKIKIVQEEFTFCYLDNFKKPILPTRSMLNSCAACRVNLLVRDRNIATHCQTKYRVWRLTCLPDVESQLLAVVLARV